MIPLTLANLKEEYVIVKIGGNDEIRHHLNNLGFVIGGQISVITSMNGNLIVKVKESRVALDQELARRIMV